MSIGMLMTEVVVATTKTPVDPDTLGFFISDRVKSSIITPSLIMLPPLRAMAIRLLSTLTVKIPSIIEDLASTLSVKLKPEGNSIYIIPSAGIGLTVVNETVTLLIVPATNDCGMTLVFSNVNVPGVFTITTFDKIALESAVAQKIS